MFKVFQKKKSEAELDNEKKEHELEPYRRELDRQLKEIENGSLYAPVPREKSASMVINLSSSGNSFFGQYPLRSGALAGGAFGGVMGFFIGSRLDMGWWLYTTTLGAALMGSLLAIVITLLAIEISDCFFTLDEHRFGADTNTVIINKR